MVQTMSHSRTLAATFIAALALPMFAAAAPAQAYPVQGTAHTRLPTVNCDRDRYRLPDVSNNVVAYSRATDGSKDLYAVITYPDVVWGVTMYPPFNAGWKPTDATHAVYTYKRADFADCATSTTPTPPQCRPGVVWKMAPHYCRHSTN